MSYIDPERKLLWHTDHIAHLQRGQTPPAPINVEIDLTNRCSLGCEWCHFAYTHTRGPLAGKRAKPAGAIAGGDEMSFGVLLRILRQLHEAGVKSVTWTGGGEPTLYPSFWSLIYHCPLPQGLYTHGGHISKELAAGVKERMEWVYVSLDEADADQYRRRKGVDRFGDAIAGVQRLVEADGDAVIGLGFLLHQENWRQAPGMVQLGEWLGVDYVQFRPVINYNMAEPGQKLPGGDWLGQAAFMVDRLAKESDIVLNTRERFGMYAGWAGHGYDTCHWANLQVAITPNGKVWDCVNKREFPGAELGDLSREPWAKVWARRGRVGVDESCRVMCRGHVANVALEDILTRPVHAEFV